MSIPGSASPLFLSAAAAAAPAVYEISRSLRFNSADSSYLSRTPSSAGNRRTWTWSGWVKRSAVSTSAFQNLFSANNSFPGIRFNNVDKLELFEYSGSYVWQALTSAVFRDPSAWYHICFLYDTTQATAADRIKLYVNNQIQTYSSVSYPSQNRDGGINSNVGHTIGCSFNGGTTTEFFNGYLADVHFIDGQALAPTDFGEYDSNNVWQPKAYSGTYGTNGFHLDFSDNSSNEALGYDQKETVTLNPNGGMAVVTYTGTASQQSITGVGFQPDLVWLKRRDSAGNHNIQDVVRGASAFLQSDYSGPESTSGSRLSSFDTDGFTVTSDNGSNASGGSYVGWCWKAGGAATTLTTGSVHAQVSASTDYGFSIITATMPSTSNLGCTVAHGLGSAPAMYIVKDRDLGINWGVYHQGLSSPSTKALQLSTTSGEFDATNYWKSTSPTSSVLSLGTSIVGEGNDFVVYAWSEVSGFSKFGSHSGNGSTQAITTGFKPAWILIKRYDSSAAGADWYILDSKRVSGTQEYLLSPNLSTAETATLADYVVLNDDGFTLQTGTTLNGSGRSYIYAAFADRPGNNFDVNNLSVAAGADNDSLVDSPTNGTQTDTGAGGEVVGNYATLNPADYTIGTKTFSNGNLDISSSSTQVRGTMGLASGKWYWEITVNSTGAGAGIGICDKENSLAAFATATNYCWGGDNNKYINGSSQGGSGTTAYGAGDIVGLALDVDASTLQFYRNGSAAFSFSSLPSEVWFPWLHINGFNFTCNFGQRPFVYQNVGVNRPSADFKALCTANLPAPTIEDPSTVMDVALYSGNGSTQTISGLNFSPDFIWIKERTDEVGHYLSNTVVGVNKNLQSNATNTEVTNHPNGYVSAATSDGFTVTAGSNNDFYTNGSPETYVAWTWDGGTSNTSISAGDLNSSVYNQSQVWSSNASGGSMVLPWTKAFDGNISGSYAAQTGSTAGTVTFNPAIDVGSGVEIAGGSGATVTFNLVGGSSVSDNPVSYSAFSQVSGLTSGQIQSMTLSANQALSGVKVDGRILVDTNITPPTNYPSIASTVRANASAGFSIVTFTSPSSGNFTIGHGLGVAPSLIIAKDRTNTGNWHVYHASVTAATDKYLLLNTTNSLLTFTNVWGSALPTSTVFGMGVGASIAANADTVAYCFAPVAGYSAFGSYTGNNSADGPFVYTGFRPKWLLIKNSSNGGNWNLFDATRSTYNATGHLLLPNTNNGEYSQSPYNDFLSNGFKVRTTDSGKSGLNANQSGNTYIWAAFAEHPFKTARAR